MKKRIHLEIGGRVQGVCFRMEAQTEACRLGLTGWVRNTRDARVELVAEGEEKQLAALKKWCNKGPPLARVTAVGADWDDCTGEFAEFSIRY